MINLVQSDISKKVIYNIKNGNSHQLMDEEGITLDVVAIYQYETIRNNMESGDRNCISTTLITKDGEYHSTLSDTVARCAQALVDTFGMPSMENVIRVKVTTRLSKGKRKFFILEAA